MRSLSAIFVFVVIAAAANCEIVLDGYPLLFADDSGIASSKGVTRSVHPARTSTSPVIEPEAPWEEGRVYVYGSVYRDQGTGTLRLWYASIGAVLFASSSDGVKWQRPSLGIHAAKKYPGNNIVHYLHSPSVLFDMREKDPQKRYKMIGSKFLRDKETRKVDMRRTGYYTATSPDGLRWKEVASTPTLTYWDTVTLTQDSRTGEYLAYHKRHWNHRGFNRRTVWLAQSSDFVTWGEPELVFAPDEEDDAWATLPEQRTEVYNMSVLPHAAGFLGFPTMFRVTASNRPDMAPNQSPTDGPINVQLTTSADGINWVRTSPRTVIIANGPAGSFDAGCILGVSSTAVDVDDETWMYYTGINTTHGGPMPPKRICIGRVVWRRHGFASLDAVAKGRVETLPVRLASPALIVNADASRGKLRAGIIETDGSPVKGLSIAECEPLQADATRYPLRWRTGAFPPINRAVIVVIEMEHCRLFSLSTKQIGDER